MYGTTNHHVKKNKPDFRKLTCFLSCMESSLKKSHKVMKVQEVPLEKRERSRGGKGGIKECNMGVNMTKVCHLHVCKCHNEAPYFDN
jgi:hypothetical protein